MSPTSAGKPWVLDLSAYRVIEVRREPAELAIVFGLDEPELDLHVAGPYSLRTPLLTRARDPQQADDAGSLPTLRALKPVRLTAQRDGQLLVAFEGAIELVVLPQQDYEAWELAGRTNGLLVVAAAGGGLGIWEPGR